MCNGRGPENCLMFTPVEAFQLTENETVKTPFGELAAHAGDYIVRNAEGEEYPVKKETFEKNFKSTNDPGEMDMVLALTKLKDGYKIRRSSWPKGKYLIRTKNFSITDIDNIERSAVETSVFGYSVFTGLIQINSNKSFMKSFIAADEDIFSRDWEIASDYDGVK